MDFKKHYDLLCNTRSKLNRDKNCKVYYESHHIIPKCLGGSNNLDNLVLFTAREHFIAHPLLYDYYRKIGGSEFRKIAFALVSMSAFKNKNRSLLRLNSRQYQTIREAAVNSSLGRKMSDTSFFKKPKSEKHKEAIRQARFKAPPRSSQTREKMRISAINRDDNLKGNYTISQCPHCNRQGQTNAMLRWHFSKCRNKKNNYA